MCNKHPPPNPTDDHERLVRIETRIVKIMEALHLDPRSGVPLLKVQSRRPPPPNRYPRRTDGTE